MGKISSIFVPYLGHCSKSGRWKGLEFFIGVFQWRALAVRFDGQPMRTWGTFFRVTAPSFDQAEVVHHVMLSRQSRDVHPAIMWCPPGNHVMLPEPLLPGHKLTSSLICTYFGFWYSTVNVSFSIWIVPVLLVSWLQNTADIKKNSFWCGQKVLFSKQVQVL